MSVGSEYDKALADNSGQSPIYFLKPIGQKQNDRTTADITAYGKIVVKSVAVGRYRFYNMDTLYGQ